MLVTTIELHTDESLGINNGCKV